MPNTKLNHSEIDNTRKTLKGLCNLSRKLGYKDPQFQLQNSDGSCVGDFLEFLEDNEGACEALIEWISDFYGKDEEDESLDEEDLDTGLEE